MIPIPLIGTAISAISGWFGKKQEIKKTQVIAKGKLEQAKLEGKQAIEMTDAEWESIASEKQDSTWKDEYITVSVASILNLIVIGGIAAAFGEPRVLEGVSIALKALSDAGVDMGTLLTAVVFAAIGLKLWRA